MTDFQARLDALPEWAERQLASTPVLSDLLYRADNFEAALARLALAREVLDNDVVYKALRYDLGMSADDIFAMMAKLEGPR